MSALHLHHAFFANEKDSDLPLRSASPFLRLAPESNESPTSHLLASAAYQDLIQRQPTHPDGPTSGWDLGLNLLGDPITAAEHKGLEDHRTKMKLRRLRAINTTLELLFGVWSTYITVRYFLAFTDDLVGSERVCTVVLGVVSALALALVTMSIMMPLLPHHNHLSTWRHPRSLLRACYLLLLYAGAMMNLILILIWHPDQLCNWDLDISWYAPVARTTTSSCHMAPFAAWVAAGILRLAVTSMMALSFFYTLRSFHGTRHPTSEGNGPRYSPYLTSDPEYASPVSTSSPFDHVSKSTLKFSRSDDSSHTLNHSNITLPKSNSISTLAPSTSCMGHSRSHSTLPPKDNSPPRISPSTSRRTASLASATHQGSSHTYAWAETPSQIQAVNVGTVTSSASQILRHTSRISVIPVTSDTATSDISERCTGSTSSPRDSSEIRLWKPGHRTTATHPDGRKPTLGWEIAHPGHAASASVGSDSFTSTFGDGESVKETERHKDDNALVYSYGYGASGSTYPYLDIYNPPPSRSGHTVTLSTLLCEVLDRRGPSSSSQTQRRTTTPSLPAFLPDAASSEPPSSSLLSSRKKGDEGEDEEEDEEDTHSSEEEEYVAMMGGFVRRMATIESLGSREVASVLSATTGSVARRSVRSGSTRAAPASPFSSVRFADYAPSSSRGSSSFSALAGTGTMSGASTTGTVTGTSSDGSFSTAYFSFSSGGTGGGGLRVNERGELLLPDRDEKMGTEDSSHAGQRDYDYNYSTSGRSLPRSLDGEDR